MWRQVKLKEKWNVIEFDLKNVSVKKHKETKKGFISFKSIIFVKNMFCLSFSPIAKLWSRKKVTFEVFVFWRYSRTLKTNLEKSEIAGIGVLKGVQVAACGIRCIDLNNDTLKIWVTHFSYNEKLKEEIIIRL